MLQNLRILLADDEALIRMDLREMLLDAGYEVIGEASNGEEAVRLARSLKPDFVIMDVKMPVMDGLEATRIIRQKSTEIPIIALTAFAFDQDRIRVMEAGCNDFLTKPLSPPLLKETIIKYLK